MKKISLVKALLASTFVLSPYVSFAETAKEVSTKEDVDLTNMSLEELMNQQVYSVSKRPEKLSDAAASVYVITSEDIKKAGVTSIPEALRMVPGVDVAQTNANTWAITIRGFNYQYSNKLLVLVDGRSVYTPTFSGVYWDSQDYVLDDIDRIEVIKGPGGTLWGANAVNGVINIITKEARKTQGNYASTTIGSNQQEVAEYRYGGKTGDDGYYRVYGKFNHDGEFPNVINHADNNDDWAKAQSGFRYDFRDFDYNKVSLHADIFDGKKEFPMALPNNIAPPFTTNNFINEGFSGANVMLNWNIVTDKFNTDIKAYSDYTRRNDLPVLKQEIYTQDIDVQTQYDWGRNSFIGGGEIRYITDNLPGSQWDSYSSVKSSVAIFSTFLQDKINVYDDKLFLTLGSKFDYNDYTDFEVEPNVRLSYQINDHHSIWAAVSQAVRTPTRGEDGFAQLAPDGPPLGVVLVTGNNSYGSEKLTAYEVGYRGDITDKVFLDVSTFYNDYSDLRTTEPIGGAFVSSFNNGYAENYGIEAYSVIGVTKGWDLKPGYAFLLQNFHTPPGNPDTLLAHDEERSPENQFSIGSFVKLADDINWDTSLYYVSNLHYWTNAAVPVRTKIDGYARFDTQVRWNVMKDVELSLIGQNLFDDKHQEFNEAFLTTPSEIPRTVLVRATVKF